jgi:hypothetical protein
MEVLLLVVTCWEITDKIRRSLQLHRLVAEVVLNIPELETMAGLVEEVLTIQQQLEPLGKGLMVVLKVETITEMSVRLVEAQEQ